MGRLLGRGREAGQAGDAAIEAGGRQDAFDQVGDPATDEPAYSEDDGGGEDVGNRRQDGREDGHGGNREGFDAELFQGGDGDRDEDQDEHQGTDGRADTGRSGRLCQTGLLKPAIGVGGLQGGLDDPPGQGGDDETDEEDQDGAQHARDEGGDLGQKGVEGGDDLAEVEDAERRDDAEKQDQPEGDVAQARADRMFGIIAGGRFRGARNAVDALGQRPFDGLADKPGRDQDDQGSERLGAPFVNERVPADELVVCRLHSTLHDAPSQASPN